MIRPKRDLGPTLAAIAAGACVGAALLAAHVKPLLAGLAAWDAGAAFYLVVFWAVLAQLPAQPTQARAAAEDPGRAAVSALVVLGSAASLLSAVAIAGRAKAPHLSPLVILCFANVALSWALTHAAFTLRYAHLYYRDDDEGVGGVDFPGAEAPEFFDFAYLAYTIGMTFQVSDTTVSSPQIRRLVLLHALLSFLYNTAIIAFVLNLLFNLA